MHSLKEFAGKIYVANLQTKNWAHDRDLKFYRIWKRSQLDMELLVFMTDDAQVILG